MTGEPCPHCSPCTGTHRHRGRAGDTLHGLFHETDPSLLHHHCDDGCTDRCRFCRGTGVLQPWSGRLLPPWDSPTVRGIMAGILADLDLSRLPALADALDDTNVADPAETEALRMGDVLALNDVLDRFTTALSDSLHPDLSTRREDWAAAASRADAQAHWTRTGNMDDLPTPLPEVARQMIADARRSREEAAFRRLREYAAEPDGGFDRPRGTVESFMVLDEDSVVGDNSWGRIVNTFEAGPSMSVPAGGPVLVVPPGSTVDMLSNTEPAFPATPPAEHLLRADCPCPACVAFRRGYPRSSQ